ncbi:hypothetical protein [Nonomuraea guangzhouensis]|uniref:hypothetical protein n=1 Tax=Nonomuraea guangzhouensis TaxID=1291555 RepID=UPI001C5D731A|nr:hypothetical protein [Nonomuraea guangzhouensis]
MAWAVGIILTVGLIASTALVIALFPDSPYCAEYTGCLGLLVQAWEVGTRIARPMLALTVASLLAFYLLAAALLPD